MAQDRYNQERLNPYPVEGFQKAPDEKINYSGTGNRSTIPREHGEIPNFDAEEMGKTGLIQRERL